MFPAHVRHCAAAFFADVALSAAFTVVPFHIFNILGGGAPMSGHMMAVQSLVYGFGCIGLAKLIQTSPRSMTYAGLACLVSAVSMIFMGLSTSVVPFTAWFMVGMTIQCFYWPAMQSWLGGERNPVLRARRIGIYNLSWCMGLAVGPLFAGPLYDYGGSLAGFGFAACAVVIAAALTLSLPPRFAPPPNAAPHEEQVDHEGETHLYATWLASFTGWLLVGVCRSVLPKRVDELVAQGELSLLGTSLTDGSLFHAATFFSWLVFVLYFMRAGMSIIMGRTVWWRYSLPALAWLQLFAGGAFWVMGASHDLLLLALAATVVGINGAASFFASLEYSLSSMTKSGSRASIHEGMVGLGSALGGATFGFLAGLYGTAWPFLYTPILIVLSLVLQFALLRRSRRRAPAPV